MPASQLAETTSVNTETPPAKIPPALAALNLTLPMDVMGIMKLLPHRYPFLLIDRVLSLDPGEQVVCRKNVTFNEPFFPGHFPIKPVMPGVLIIEAMAQAGAVLVMGGAGEPADGKIVYFMSIEGAKFRKPVEPGDQLEIVVTILRNRRNIWKLSGKAYVDGKVAAEAEFSAMIVDDPENT